MKPNGSRKAPLLKEFGLRLGDQGLALITTLIVMVVLTAVIAVTVTSSLTLMKTATADYQGTRAFYAAEAGAESAMSQIELALLDGVIDSAELVGMVPPGLEGFEFTEYSVEKDGPVQIETVSDGPFAGMVSLTQDMLITSKATDPIGAHAAVVLGAKAQAIPIFQFAIFFEGDLEDYAGSRKDTWGRAHANGDLFLGGADLHFHNTVTTPGRVHRDHKISHDDPNNAGVWIEDASGTDVLLTFDSDDTPDAEQFKQKSTTDFDGNLKTGAFGVEALKLPLPDGISPHEIIRPREGGDTQSEKETKFAWKADMYVTVDLNDVKDESLVCGGAGSGVHPDITVTRPNGGAVPSDAKKCDIFDWDYEKFIERAEDRWADALDVDIGELRTWLNAASANTEIIYVEIIPRTGGPAAGTDSKNDGHFPVLRVENGAQLPGPLTVGSEYPLYVRGDYNSINWQPAALFGDRLAAFSNTWDDSNVNAKPKVFANTEQYFAVVTGTGEGFIGCFHEDSGCTPPANGGSGWVKLLEDWKGGCGGQPEGNRCIHRMIGSFVTLWAPQKASAIGGVPVPGTDYYRRPIRDWSFDTRFENPDSLPPGTPVVGQVFRAAFREAY